MGSTEEFASSPYLSVRGDRLFVEDCYFSTENIGMNIKLFCSRQVVMP